VGGVPQKPPLRVLRSTTRLAGVGYLRALRGVLRTARSLGRGPRYPSDDGLAVYFRDTSASAKGRGHTRAKQIQGVVRGQPVHVLHPGHAGTVLSVYTLRRETSVTLGRRVGRRVLDLFHEESGRRRDYTCLVLAAFNGTDGFEARRCAGQEERGVGQGNVRVVREVRRKGRPPSLMDITERKRAEEREVRSASGAFESAAIRNGPGGSGRPLDGGHDAV